MSDTAQTRIPQCLAAIASTTVLMPAMVPPQLFTIRISAGVSYDGPVNCTYTPSFSGMLSSFAAARSTSHSSGS